MASINIVERAQISSTLRIESEFYLPKYVNLKKKLLSIPHSTLSKLVSQKIMTGHTPSMKVDSYYGGNINFVKTDNLRDNLITDDFTNTLSISGCNLISKTALQKDDIITTIIGATHEIIARSAIVDDEILPANINQNIALIRVDKNKIRPEYLSAYLTTSFGKTYLHYLSRQTGQVNLNCTEVEQVLVPMFSEKLQTKIAEVINQSRENRRDSSIFYAKALEIFLFSLGLENWQPTQAKTFPRTFSEVQNSFRIDGEHFHPKFDELQKIVRKNATYCKTIGSIKTFNSRGAQPKYYEDGELKVINSQHILETHLDYDNFERTDISFWETEKESRVYKNDILIYTTGANIGRANVYLQEDKAVASNHTNILRIKDENPIYVGFALNSIVGRLQTEKMKTGSAQAEIYPSAFNQFVIPFIDKRKQEEIAKLYVQSYELSNQSKQLIEKAKRAVEIAIEKSEKIAIDFLSN
jgi:restriction endonuclease S subunit